MSSIFLSHSSADNFVAVALRDWLASEGWDDVFLDLDSERGIAAGERWERALHEAATRCEAVIFLVSAHWLASGWCLKEYNLARALNKKLFAVIVDPGKSIADLPPELKGTWQVVDLAGGQDGQLTLAQLPSSHEEKHVVFSKDGLKRLKRGLDKAGLDPKFFSWPPDSDRERAPYRGLKPLEGVDAGIFFGREAPIVEVTDRLRGLKSAAPPRLLVILGASGAGKSSFLRAGLLPRLARDERNFLPLPVIRPERAALSGEYGLLHALDAVLPNHTRAEIRAAIHAGVAGVRPLLNDLVTASMKGASAAQDAAKPPAVVLAIDQAEELFRPEGAEEGAALLSLIRDLTREDAPAVIAIFAIRSDSYDALEHAKPLEGLAQATLPLLPMPRGAYKDVIEGPARRYAAAGGALTIEPQLTQRLLEDIDKGGGSDALPLLAFTLEQLFLDYRRSGALRLTNYEDFGGLRGAIDAAVERAFACADADPRVPRERKAREALLRRGLIPWLAGVDPDSKSPRRNIARRADIPEEAAPLIALLVEERLLSTDTVESKDAATGVESRIVTIEPAHEALLRQWGLLQGWLEEDFGLLATLEGVKRAARDWEANGKAEPWLVHRGQRLSDAHALDARSDIKAKLDATERIYLRENEQAAAREDRSKREAAERVASANSTARDNLCAALSALSSVALPTSPTRAVKLALAAWPRGPQDTTRKLDVAMAALAAAVPQLRERKILRGHDDRIFSAAFSPDGTRVLTASADKTARLWDAATGKETVALRGHEAGVLSAAFSPDGRRVVTASADGTARLWDAKTGTPIAAARGHEGKVFSAVFSPDGTRVVTASADRTARLWDAATGEEISVLRGHERAVAGAAFSPDGRRVVTVGDDNTARLWDAATGGTLILRGHEERVFSAAFSPDGSRVVTAARDRTARLWKVETGEQIVVLRGHERRVSSASFSPDGTRVVTASADKTARLWDTVTGDEIVVLRGHDDRVVSAAFSPDGTRVVTVSDDKTASLWDAATGASIIVLRGHEERVLDAGFSLDGGRVVTASTDRTARLWDAATGSSIVVLRGHEDRVLAAEFSPDGRRVVTASADKTARLWDAGSGAQIVVLGAHDDGVLSVAFSPDGKRIVAATGERVARMWEAKAGEETAALQGHDDRVMSAAFSADGTRIVTASADKTARLWNATTGKEAFALRGHEAGVLSAAFSPDGRRVVTASVDKTARLWNAATGMQVAVLRDHEYKVSSAAFSPDGMRVLTVCDYTAVRLWDAATGRQVVTLRGHDDRVLGAAFSPDGRRVAITFGDTTAGLWDAATGKEVVVLRGHDNMVLSAGFSPDGTRVVTASDDRTARLWDAATGAPIAVLRGAEGGVLSAAFSPDGARIVAASSDKTARIWVVSHIPKGDIFQIACAWLPDHDLTDIARDYGLTNLEPICEGDPPLPDSIGK